MPPPGQRVFDSFEAPSSGSGPDAERSAQLGRWADSPRPERGGAPGYSPADAGAWDTPAPRGYEGPADPEPYRRPPPGGGSDLWGSAREPGRPPSPPEPGPDGDRFGPPMSAWRPEQGGRNGLGTEGRSEPFGARERGPAGPGDAPPPPLRERFGEPGRGSGVGEQPPSRERPDQPPAGHRPESRPERGRPEPPVWRAPTGAPDPGAWAPPSGPPRPDGPDVRPGFDRKRATRETPGGWEPAAYRDEPPAPQRRPQQQPPPPRPGVFPGGQDDQQGLRQQPPPGYGPIPARPGRGAPGNAMAALAYAPGLLGAMTLIIGWILRFQGMIRIGSLLIVLGIAAAVVLRARDRTNREVAFHAGQSIALDVVASASLLITLVVVPYMPLISSLLFLAPWFGYVAAKAYLLIRAIQGMEARLPVLGDIGDLYAPGSRGRDGGTRH
jgi:uncharacterized membrane protein